MAQLAQYDFRISKQEQIEMQKQYESLEVVVKQIKRVLSQLNGFNTMYEPYKNIFNILAPDTVVTSPLGKLNLRKFSKVVAAVIGSLLLLFVALPMISGFLKVPWPEVATIVFCIILMWLIVHFRIHFRIDI